VRRSLTLLAHDLRLQARRGFPAAYAVVTFFYVLLLRAAPDAVHDRALPALLFSDPAALGGFFIGGLLLLERGEGTLTALFVTPVRTADYLAAKVVSLTALALAASLALALATARAPVRWLPLALSVALTSSMIVLAGIAVASRIATVNQYFFAISVAGLPLGLPLAGTLHLGHTRLFMLIPSGPALRLMESSLRGEPVAPAAVGACVAALLAWNGLAWIWAARWLERYVRGRVKGRG
jgi:fluoroquinolone transport system permease protein